MVQGTSRLHWQIYSLQILFSLQLFFTPVLWTQTYVYGEALEAPNIDNCFTPFFFVIMEMICGSFGFDNFLKRLMNAMPGSSSVSSVFTFLISCRHTNQHFVQNKKLRQLLALTVDHDIEEHLFGSGFLAFMDWVMIACSQVSGKANYVGADKGATWEALRAPYMVRVCVRTHSILGSSFFLPLFQKICLCLCAHAKAPTHVARRKLRR